jgi:hypothetical protein
VLRQAAYQAAGGVLLRGNIRLTLIVCFGARQRRRNDLDHMIVGTANALAAATTTAKLATAWSDPALAHIYPTGPLLYRNDRQIVSLRADIDMSEGSTEPWYTVTVEEL